jgi:hypothetical protein
VASLSAAYLAKKKDREGKSGTELSGSVQALFYTVGNDLTSMLMATKNKMDRIPVIYLKEANS